MKLITDGERWAIRKGFFFKQWYDMRDGYWWPRRYMAKYHRDVWVDKATAERWIKRLRSWT